MVDEYLLGSVNRISPEAPVPVVDVETTRQLLGGAANVAANIKALGDEPLLLCVVGEDEAATKLSGLLKDKNISADMLLADESRKTTIKTRVIAHSQQVVRADQETRHGLSAEMEKEVLTQLSRLAPDLGAIIISDYGKGMITRSLLEEVIRISLEHGIFIAVDPKETRFQYYKRVSLITPNHHEAGFAYGLRVNNLDDLLEVGHGLIEKLEAEAILITRGAEGMSLFRRGHRPTHIPTFARQVYDVTGAGDTVIATYVSAICAGADSIEAAVVANAGAGYTVAKIGTASVTVPQLMKELSRNLADGKLTGSTAGN